jgi:hypothetical protein
MYIVFEKLIVIQLVNKYHYVYGTRYVITAFATTRQWTLYVFFASINIHRVVIDMHKETRIGLRYCCLIFTKTRMHLQI